MLCNSLKKRECVLGCLVMSDSATLYTAPHQDPLSVEFSKQEYWSGFPCPPPEDLPNPGIEPRSPAWQAGCLLSELPGKPICIRQIPNVECFNWLF